MITFAHCASIAKSVQPHWVCGAAASSQWTSYCINQFDLKRPFDEEIFCFLKSNYEQSAGKKSFNNAVKQL